MSAPSSSRALDRATGVVGLLVLGIALLGSAPPWPAWSAVPVIALAARRPLVLPTTSSGSLVIGLDSSLLITLGLVLPYQQALLVWAVSVFVGELASSRSLDTRLFNAGVCVLSGVVALGLLSRVAVTDRTSPVGLLVTGAAAAAYFAVDYTWSAVSVAVAERGSVWQTLRAPGLLLAFACFLAVDSLGFLAAVVLRAEAWAVVLLALPFVSLQLATHSWSHLRRAEQQSGVLSAAAVALQAAESLEDLEQLLIEHAPLLVRAPSASWQDDASAGQDPRLSFVADGCSRELVVAARTSGERLGAQDLEALRILVGVAEQAAERLVLLRQLRRSASHDSLTGLANRSAFHDALAVAVDGTERIAVLYCDLDGFKQINDARGHAAGDALLVAVAARLRAAVRPRDLAVRLGGDEFAVLLRGLATGDLVEEAAGIAERVAVALAAPYEIAGCPAAVTASIGLCVRTAGELPEELLHASDTAMYAAKSRGGGRVHVHRARSARQPGPEIGVAHPRDGQAGPAGAAGGAAAGGVGVDCRR